MVLPVLSTRLCAQSALENIATIKEGVKSLRISSYDRSGGNNDRFENNVLGRKRIPFGGVAHRTFLRAGVGRDISLGERTNWKTVNHA